MVNAIGDMIANRFDIFSASSLPFTGVRESADFLRTARDGFNVLNLSYWYLGASTDIPDRMTWLSTYHEDYMALYMRDYTPLKDRAFNICFKRLLPLDWEEVRTTDQS